MATENSLVLAVGASGPYAGLVVPELARRGARVRGLIRDPKEEDAVRRAGATEVAIGDLNDAARLDAALAGVDRAFYVGPAYMPNGESVGRRFVESAERAGVRRIVFSGVIHPTLGDLENHIGTAPIESAILDSGLEYAFLHPAVFYQGLAAFWPKVLETGEFAEPWSAGTRFSRIDYRDVAEVAAIALTEDRLNYGTYELCGDGSFDRADIAALMGEALGREVRVGTADASKVPGPEGLRRMFAWYDRHGLRGNPLTLRAILGREPRTLRDYIGELSKS